MADVIRDVEFFDLIGHQRRADLSKRSIVVGAYLDTGAGRTIVSTRIADNVRMIDVPSYRIQYTVPINQVASTRMTAMRLRVPGCVNRKPVPMLVAVSDEIIGKLELPGVEVLVGQDYMQAARMRMDLAPGREPQQVSCRPPPRGYGKVRYGEAVRATWFGRTTSPRGLEILRRYQGFQFPESILSSDDLAEADALLADGFLEVRRMAKHGRVLVVTRKGRTEVAGTLGLVHPHYR